jgi:hypothetical protein
VGVGGCASPDGGISARRRDRKDDEHALVVPVDGGFGVGDRIAAHVHVGEDPVAVHGLAREWRADRVAHEAVSPIAADDPIRRRLLFAPVRGAKDGISAIVAQCKADDFRLPLHFDAERLQPFLQEPFGVGLRDHQSIGIGAGDRLHAGASDQLVTGEEAESRDFEARLQEGRRATRLPVQKLQRPAPEDQSL